MNIFRLKTAISSLKIHIFSVEIRIFTLKMYIFKLKIKLIPYLSTLSRATPAVLASTPDGLLPIFTPAGISASSAIKQIPASRYHIGKRGSFYLHKSGYVIMTN